MLLVLVWIPCSLPSPGLNHRIHAKLTLWNPTIFNIIRWVAGTIVSSSKHLMFQVLFFFQNFLQNFCITPFNLFFYFFLTLQKWKQRVLSALSLSQQPTVLFSIYLNNTWTIRHLVNETSDSATQRNILKIVGFKVSRLGPTARNSHHRNFYDFMV
jgi:hypothetical protein